MSNFTASVIRLATTVAPGRFASPTPKLVVVPHGPELVGYFSGATFLSLVTAIMNMFFVAAFAINGGSIYPCFLGTTDLFASGLLLVPTVTMVFSETEDVVHLCHAQQFIVNAASYMSSLFYLIVAAESYIQIVINNDEAIKRFRAVNPYMVAGGIIAASIGVACVGMIWELDHDYCTPSNHGYWVFILCTSIVFYGLPFLATVYYYVSCIRITGCRRGPAEGGPRDDPDRPSLFLGLVTYLLFAGALAVYLVLVFYFPALSTEYFYILTWVGVERSMFVCALNIILDHVFRQPYIRLYHFLTCGGGLTAGHMRRALERGRPRQDPDLDIELQELPRPAGAITGVQPPPRQDPDLDIELQELPRPAGEITGVQPPPRQDPDLDIELQELPRPAGAITGVQPPPRQDPDLDIELQELPRPAGAITGVQPPPRRRLYFETSV